MHSAPAVSHPVGRSRFAGTLIATFGLLAAAGLAMWVWQLHPSAARMFAGVCTLVAAAAIAWRGWLQSPQGTLAWDGEGWSWTAGARSESGAPETVVDFQGVLLLRWRPHTGRVRWFWAERRMRSSSWDELRRAVYSRARPGGGAARHAWGEG